MLRVIIVRSNPLVVEVRQDDSDEWVSRQTCESIEQATVYANGIVAGLKAAAHVAAPPLGFRFEDVK